MTTHSSTLQASGRGQATSADRRRQVVVTVSEVLCVVGTLVGVGVLGTRVEESSGGSLAADATSVSYTHLDVYTRQIEGDEERVAGG